ncbi:MAG: iron chelate uptake ABC transporter family permease subunit, partial [Pseudomonadota bacterium]
MEAVAPGQRVQTARPALLTLGAIVALLATAELALGPVTIPPERVIATLFGGGTPVEQAILWQIRLPRLVLGLATGAALAV